MKVHFFYHYVLQCLLIAQTKEIPTDNPLKAELDQLSTKGSFCLYAGPGPCWDFYRNF
jgi:hypothetical protein